jgi:hypothetical protein
MTNADSSEPSTTVPGPQADWITKRVDQALLTCPANDAVVSAVKLQLGGTMRERPLTAAELAKVSKTLIAATNAPQAKESAK